MKKGVHGPLARSGNSPPPKLDYRPPPDTGLVILHKDEDVLVLSKPAGLLSVPGKEPDLQDCVETRAQSRFPQATTIHRLDRGTSGIFLMALNARAHRIIGKQFEDRKIEKTYVAIVAGRIEEREGEVGHPLRTDWYNRPKQMVDNCLGREAVTRWKVIDRKGDATRLELYPKTGRTHQLRVHMQSICHPILGDEFYAPQEVATLADRLLLHAEVIRFRHPKDGEWITIHDPCPF